MRRGFTLVEVVVALLLVEVVVFGGIGLLAIASSTLTAAEELERAVALAEGVLDSLSLAPARDDGAASYLGGEVRWSVGADGATLVAATDSRGRALFEIRAVLPP